MKKFFLAITGIILVLLIAGIVTGRISLFGAELSGSDIVQSVGDYIDDKIGNPNYDINEAMHYDGNFPVLSGDLEKTFPKEEIKELAVEAAGCSVTIMPTEDDLFCVTAFSVGSIQCYEENGILYLRTSTAAQSWGADKTAEVRLYVPTGYLLQNTEIHLGAGSLDCSDLTALSMKLEAGAGKLTGTDLTTNMMEVNVGMGAMELKQVKAGAISAETGMGSLQVEGYLAGDAYVKCSAGSARFLLDGRAEDYNYVIKAGAGAVTVGEETVNGATGGKQIPNNAESNVTLECLLGKIELLFPNS